MNKIIAYCGLVCTGCPAFVATQASDHQALERVAAEWREAFNAAEITADSIICDGCLGSNGGRFCFHCYECGVRACGVERGVDNCAHCADYGCDKLVGFFEHAPEARATLDEIWHGLNRGLNR